MLLQHMAMPLTSWKRFPRNAREFSRIGYA